tara:strand:+ start:678 stop:1343 length:666 start_codon:yes stop_codon:yes gene_type:complete
MAHEGNIFLDTIDISRAAYINSQNIPLNNSLKQTFHSGNATRTQSSSNNDLFINHKEAFETNNTRINDLNDEIRELKNKLRIIYEKDKEIDALQCENKQLLHELDDLRRIYNSSKLALDALKTKEQEYIQNIRSLEERNKALSEESNNERINTEDEGDTQDKANKIQINIPRLKSILYSRLKTYHEQHIEDLIESYELHNKTEIDKELMERILVEAIHMKL